MRFFYYYNYIQEDILYPTYIPTKPPIVLRAILDIERNPAPHNVGNQPPTEPPTNTPIHIRCLVSIDILYNNRSLAYK